MASGTTRMCAKPEVTSHAVHLPFMFLLQSIYLVGTWTIVFEAPAFPSTDDCHQREIILGRPARMIHGTLSSDGNPRDLCTEHTVAKRPIRA